jgi:hypothetical protein
MAAHDDEQNQPEMFDPYRRGRILDDRRSGEDRRDEAPTAGLRVQWAVIAQAVGWIVGLFVIYNAMTSRLTALETNRANDTQRMERSEQRMERIESKLDRLLEQRK